MEIYLIVYIVCIISILLKPRTEIIGIIIFTTMLMVSMFRGETVGIDTVNYYNNKFSADFESAIELTNHDYEWLFVGFCDFIRNFGFDPRWCLYFLTLVTFFFLGVSARVYKVNLLYVCFFYLLFSFFSLSLNIARQMAGCSIILYAYSYLRFDDRRRFLFFVFIILAASIHASAFLFSLCYLVRYMKNFNKLKEISLVIYVLLLYSILQLFREFVLEKALGSIGLWSIYTMVGESTEETSLSLFGFIYRSIALVISLHIYMKLRNVYNNPILKVYFIGIIIKILLSPLYGNISRIGLYLYAADVIVFSYFFIYFKWKNSIDRTKNFLLYTAYYSYEFIMVLVGNTFGTVPYVMSI